MRRVQLPWRRRAPVPVGGIAVDRVTFAEALEAIDLLVDSGEGGAVFTPNVDHVVLAEENPEFRTAYASADLRLADGMPVVWASKLLGLACPERVAGADLLVPLMQRAAFRRWRVFLLGSTEATLAAASQRLVEQGVQVVGMESPWIDDPADVQAHRPLYDRIRAARPQLLIVALGAPKQELWVHHARPFLGGCVALGLGASLDFLAGAVERAPRWMSEHGLEWLYRLSREPRRLWRRYLVRDPAFAAIVAKAWVAQRERRPAVQLPAPR